eukprot:scaffold207079_cov15-Tisochrysis_lutea.AAC.1
MFLSLPSSFGMNELRRHELEQCVNRGCRAAHMCAPQFESQHRPGSSRIVQIVTGTLIWFPW